MLKKARNRCQATPIVGCSAIVIIHANEMRIFTAATMTMRFSTVSVLRPVKKLPIQPVSGKCSAVSWPVPSWRARVHSNARSSPMQIVTPRMVSST